MTKTGLLLAIIAMLGIPAAVIFLRRAFDVQPSIRQSRLVLGIIVLYNSIYAFGDLSYEAERILVPVGVGAVLLLLHDWLVKGAGIVSR